MDLQAARTVMIDSQVRTNDVHDRRLLAAIAAVPREAFAPAGLGALAYADRDIALPGGRWLMAPREMAKLMNVAHIAADDRVLVVAAGTGYLAALAARMAKSVVALDTSAGFAPTLAADSVTCVTGPLEAGWAAGAPYDVIVVDGTVEIVPPAWADQLAEGGRLCVIVSEGGVGRGRVYTRASEGVAWRAPFDGVTPVLPELRRKAEFSF